MNKISFLSAKLTNDEALCAPFEKEKGKPRAEDQNLKNAEVIAVKQKELRERAFTTFCLENWNPAELDSLATLARSNDKKFKPYYQKYTNKRGDDNRNEEDSYSKSTSFIRRAFVEGGPKEGFKEIETIIHPFGDDGALMAHPLINSILSYIYQLLPDEMRPGQDCIEVSLIRQCASSMPELRFHRDIRRYVFVLMLACNIKESEGAEMSVRDLSWFIDENKRPVLLPPVVEGINYHYCNMPSAKGNGYLIREDTETTASKEQFIEHGRGGFNTSEANPERISLRILIDDKGKPVTEAV